jgi:flagellar protein FlaJ
MNRAITGVAQVLFGRLARRGIQQYPELALQFLKGRILIHPEAYLALVYFWVAVAIILGSIVGLTFAGLFSQALGARGALTLLIGPLLGILVYLFMMMYPEMRIQTRQKQIDANLPYALNFLSAMTSAGVIPSVAFGALANQEVYGEVAEEARWIHRDVTMLGKDIVAALMDASRRSASRQFTEFLQGAVSTVNSGGDLHAYLMQKAAVASERQRRSEKSLIESIGVVAESYVVVAVAAPLFLIVIVSVLSLVSSRLVNPLDTLYIIILVFLPFIHLMFATLTKGMKPES